MDKNHKDRGNCTDMPDSFCTYRIWSAKGTWKKWNQKKYFRRSTGTRIHGINRRGLAGWMDPL